MNPSDQRGAGRSASSLVSRSTLTSAAQTGSAQTGSPLARSPLAPRYVLSIGGGYWRIWDKEQGLLQEFPPVVVVDKEQQTVKLFGEEASQLEGKLPGHLLFQRAWWEDQLVDRELTRGLLRWLLQQAAPNPWLRWQMSWRTQLLLPETVTPLHTKWLLRTAREAGWWVFQAESATLPFVRSKSKGSKVRTQAVLDVGFSATRLTVYVGDELLHTAQTNHLSTKQAAQHMAQYVREQQHLSLEPINFYDLHWQQTHTGFDETKQIARSYTPTASEVAIVRQYIQEQLSFWLTDELAQLTSEQQAELKELGIWVIGGGAALVTDDVTVAQSPASSSSNSKTSHQFRAKGTKGRERNGVQGSAQKVEAASQATSTVEWPVPLNRVPDARFATLRAAAQ